MAVLSIQTQLENVETAITTVLESGQSYTIGNRRFTRADLGELWKMHKELRAAYDAKTYGAVRNYARFEDPL